MSEALKRAYASAESTPLLTVEFKHSALTNGVFRLVRAYEDLTATLEDMSQVTFSAAGINLQLPKRNTDGRQDLTIQIDNTDLAVWNEIEAVIEANRTTEETVICVFRQFLEADLSAPAGAVMTLTVQSTAIVRQAAQIIASYSPIPDIAYPRKRYYPSDYPFLKFL